MVQTFIYFAIINDWAHKDSGTGYMFILDFIKKQSQGDIIKRGIYLEDFHKEI